MKVLLFLTSLLLCTLFQKGLAIKCVSCSSENDPYCGTTYTGPRNAASLVDCTSRSAACLKMTVGVPRITSRTCAIDVLLLACKESYVEICEICDDKDGCNGSNTLRTSTALVWLVPVLVAILNTRVGNKHS